MAKDGGGDGGEATGRVAAASSMSWAWGGRERGGTAATAGPSSSRAGLPPTNRAAAVLAARFNRASPRLPRRRGVIRAARAHRDCADATTSTAVRARGTDARRCGGGRGERRLRRRPRFRLPKRRAICFYLRNKLDGSATTSSASPSSTSTRRPQAQYQDTRVHCVQYVSASASHQIYTAEIHHEMRAAAGGAVVHSAASGGGAATQADHAARVRKAGTPGVV